MMFKLLFLKKLYDLSDEALISSAQTDMAYKFFLDLDPEALRDMSKQLRKEIYKNAFELSERFPEKPSLEAGLDEKMKELLENVQIKEIRSKADKDARFGHKTASSTFYEYKNHLAMTEERLIAGISVTNGGTPDGQELPQLIEKAQKMG